VTPPLVPRSRCRIDIKEARYRDPLQLPNPEDDLVYESPATRGCLLAMNAIVEGTLCSSIALIALLSRLADTYPISDAINTRTVQYGRLRDITTVGNYS